MKWPFVAAVAAFLFAPAYADAQGAIQQLGPVVPGHAPMWTGNGRQMDAGGSAGAGLAPANNVNPGTLLTGLAVMNSGLGNCQFSAYASAPYSSLCTGFDGHGNALISLNSIGGGAPSLSVVVNGVTYPFPGAGNGNVLGPTSPAPTSGNLVEWNGATNVKDGGFAVSSIVTGPATTTINEPMVWANITGSLAKDGLNAAISHTGSFGLTGGMSAAAWTTAGARYKNAASTITDTTSSGTVAAGYTDLFGGDTIAASSATTYTEYDTTYFQAPVAGTNVTFTKHHALGADSLIVNGESDAAGTAAYMLNGSAQTVSSEGIVMPRAKSDGSCFSAISTVIDYGAANGAPAGGSYTDWDCTTGGGTFNWVDSGSSVGTLSTTGMNVFPNAGADGYFVTPKSGTGGIAFGNSGAWTDGLDLAGGTYTDAGIVLNATATGSVIRYDASNQTDLTGSGGTGVYEIHAGGKLAGTFGASLVQLGSTAPEHLAFGQTTPPALTSCGASPTITGNDAAGTVTMGTGTPTGCVITFNAAYTAAPNCTVTWAATPLASQSYAVSNTAITLTQTATSSNVVNYSCTAQAGG